MLANRLKYARMATRQSQRSLAESVGISHNAIKKYELNQMVPTSGTIVKLAKALNVQSEYFFRPININVEAIQYRVHITISNKEIDCIKARILDQIERRLEIESLLPNIATQCYKTVAKKSSRIPCLEDVEHHAEKVRKSWGLGQNALPDMVDEFEYHGIKVIIMDKLDNNKFDGMSATINNNPVIIINANFSGDRQRFTLAHELGHLELGNVLTDIIDIEQACNRFAGAFLLPKSALIHMLGPKRKAIEPKELELIKSEYGISMVSILHRVKDAGIISDNLYNKLHMQFKQNNWETQEPGKVFPAERTNLFEQLVFHALAEDIIGESKAAELMGVSLTKFNSIRHMESNYNDTNQRC